MTNFVNGHALVPVELAVLAQSVFLHEETDVGCTVQPVLLSNRLLRIASLLSA